MPRPGPRPYECVRRAWHSDRHQPMRGSLIQQIFKVVNEIHSAATKKNKEWQEKLPVVVLKAEEIMYSKANSEAEYADPKTLWERLNDAINTIIRRDETTESGDFLQPCIEAALNLGCTPRRASRSQRHNNPRCYLSPNTQEATETSLSPKILNHMAYEGPSCLRPPQSGNPIPNTSQFAPHYSNLATSLAVSSVRPGSDSGSTVLQDKPIHRQQLNSLPMSCSELPSLSEKCTLPPKDKPSFSVDIRPSPSSGRIHPLYYISNPQTMEPRFTFQYPRDWNRDAFIVGTPQAQPIVEPKTGLLLNLLGPDNVQDALNITAQGSSDFGIPSENAHDMGYDLSLRLGQSPALENSKTLEDLGSISPHDRSRFCDPSPSKMRTSHFDCPSSCPRRDKELCFFPMDTTNDPVESCSTKWSSEGEGLQLEAPIKKRKAPIGNSIEDGQFCWQLKPSANPFFTSTKGPHS